MSIYANDGTSYTVEAETTEFPDPLDFEYEPENTGEFESEEYILALMAEPDRETHQGWEYVPERDPFSDDYVFELPPLPAPAKLVPTISERVPKPIETPKVTEKTEDLWVKCGWVIPTVVKPTIAPRSLADVIAEQEAQKNKGFAPVRKTHAEKNFFRKQEKENSSFSGKGQLNLGKKTRATANAGGRQQGSKQGTKPAPKITQFPILPVKRADPPTTVRIEAPLSFDAPMPSIPSDVPVGNRVPNPFLVPLIPESQRVPSASVSQNVPKPVPTSRMIPQIVIEEPAETDEISSIAQEEAEEQAFMSSFVKAQAKVCARPVEEILLPEKVEEVKAEPEQAWSVVGSARHPKKPAPIVAGIALRAKEAPKPAYVEKPRSCSHSHASRTSSAQKPKADEFTRMCNSVLDGTQCKYGKKCFFAHTLAQLVKVPCTFGSGCRNVRTGANGKYMNKGDRICKFWHPNETTSSYKDRLGLPVKC